MDTDADIACSRHRGAIHPPPGCRSRTSSDPPHRARPTGSAVAADSEDDVLPGGDAGPRVLVLGATAGAEYDGVVVGDLVEEGVERPWVGRGAAGGVHVAHGLVVVVAEQVRRKDLGGDSVVGDGIVGGIADDAYRPRAVSGHRDAGRDV